MPTSPPYTAFVAGLSYDAMEDDVRRFFEGCSVKSVRMPLDRETNRPKGHGFVEFNDADSLRRGTAREESGGKGPCSAGACYSQTVAERGCDERGRWQRSPSLAASS